NVYRYFESREQILLELLTSDEAEWVGALELALAPLAEQGDVDAVADIIARTLAARPRLCLLSATLSSVLEQNLSSETIEAFKDVALGLGVRIANTLHAALPALSVAAATELVHYVHALIAGLWPMGHPPEAVRAVVAAPRFAVFRHAFPAELQRGVRALLRGFLDR
ncbi:MAG: hypothetical protein KC636_27920, partial [Myxococcales bacterium]|nr:hypothetical protein [Myxococcales bacterium]